MIQGDTTADGKWSQLRGRIPVLSVDELPWESGYRLARYLRELLDIKDVFPLNLDDLVGVPFPVIQANIPPAPSFDGVIGVGKSSVCCYTARITSRIHSDFFVHEGL